MFINYILSQTLYNNAPSFSSYHELLFAILVKYVIFYVLHTIDKMPINKIISLFLFALVILVFPSSSFCKDYEHIEALFDLRTSITEQGRILPEDIKLAKGDDVRTLERTFELNTSALTTIEAYFRIVKIAIQRGSLPDAETVSILNEWLTFIKNQCTYDIEYLDAALAETQSENAKKQLTTAKQNVAKLEEIVTRGIAENSQMPR